MPDDKELRDEEDKKSTEQVQDIKPVDDSDGKADKSKVSDESSPSGDDKESGDKGDDEEVSRNPGEIVHRLGTGVTYAGESEEDWDYLDQDYERYGRL